jgi:hypothetical protein
MQFKTMPDFEEISLSDYIQVALQSGASLQILNSYQVQSKFLLQWKINYLESLLDHDIKLFNSYQAARNALLFFKKSEQKS